MVAHHKYFQVAGCDTAIPLSYRDAMFQQPADGSGPPRAMIVSLDSPTPPVERRHLRARDTPATHPFLPCEYLSASTWTGKPSSFTTFLYRQHLESLFYILAWCATRFSTLPAPLSTIGYRELDEWAVRRGEGGFYSKRRLMMSDSVFTSLLDYCVSDVLGADKDIQAWLYGLRDIVRGTVIELDRIGRCGKREGWVSFDRFLEVLLLGKYRTGGYDRGTTPRCAITVY